MRIDEKLHATSVLVEALLQAVQLLVKRLVLSVEDGAYPVRPVGGVRLPQFVRVPDSDVHAAQSRLARKGRQLADGLIALTVAEDTPLSRILEML